MEERLSEPPSLPDDPSCMLCGWAMKLVRRIPRLGVLPPQDTYRCTECGLVKTIDRRLH